jgi:hypothetical protein
VGGGDHALPLDGHKGAAAQDPGVDDRLARVTGQALSKVCGRQREPGDDRVEVGVEEPGELIEVVGRERHDLGCRRHG